GRALKVSKEQIVALLAALRLFVDGAYDKEVQEKQKLLDRITAALADRPASCRIHASTDGQTLPLLEINLDEKRLGRTAFEVCRALRQGRPRVYVGHGRLREGALVINPLHLDDERTDALIRRLKETLRS